MLSRKKKKMSRRAANDIMQSLRELAQAVTDGVSMQERFTVRTISVPEPTIYSPAQLKNIRARLGMSQAVFAELLGVSRVWVQGWERGVRKPSPLARRLLDTISANPKSWLATVWAKAS